MLGAADALCCISRCPAAQLAVFVVLLSQLVCNWAGVNYFIAACFRAGLGSRLSAQGFPCFWTALDVVQALLPGGGSGMVGLDWVPPG